jgi:hypothetical protein
MSLSIVVARLHGCRLFLPGGVAHRVGQGGCDLHPEKFKALVRQQRRLANPLATDAAIK